MTQVQDQSGVSIWELKEMGQKQGWRKSCSVDLVSMLESGLEAGTPMASVVQMGRVVGPS